MRLNLNWIGTTWALAQELILKSIVKIYIKTSENVVVFIFSVRSTFDQMVWTIHKAKKQKERSSLNALRATIGYKLR